MNFDKTTLDEELFKNFLASMKIVKDIEDIMMSDKFNEILEPIRELFNKRKVSNLEMLALAIFLMDNLSKISSNDLKLILYSTFHVYNEMYFSSDKDLNVHSSVG